METLAIAAGIAGGAASAVLLFFKLRGTNFCMP